MVFHRSSDDKNRGHVLLQPIPQTDSLYSEWDDSDSFEDTQIDTQYHQYIFRKYVFIIVCVVLAVIVAGLVISYGEFPIKFKEAYEIVWDHIWNGPPPEDQAYERMKDYAVWSLRLPRVLVGAIGGFGLAVAGVVMQSTLKNPMADSYTTGVSSGAAFGATISIVAGTSLVGSQFGLIVNAFIFSLVPTAVIILISKFRKISPTSMILAGMAVMYIFNAMTAVLKLMADPEALASLYRWQVGSLNNMLWEDVPAMFFTTLIGTIAIMLLSNKINLLSAGDDSARSLGVDAQKLRVICLVIVSLITASIVSFTGTIGFIGLVSPHIARIFIGSDNRYLIPGAGAFGALLLIVSDIIGRTVIAPSVLEVGVVTAFIGGPMFLYLIIRQKKEAWRWRSVSRTCASAMGASRSSMTSIWSSIPPVSCASSDRTA